MRRRKLLKNGRENKKTSEEKAFQGEAATGNDPEQEKRSAYPEN